MTEQLLLHIREIFQDLDSYWDKYLSSYKGIGFFCSYVPLELVRASGFIPVRILPSRSELKEAELFLPPFACHPARSYIARRKRKELLRYVDGYLFVQTCDTMQCLANIWGMNFEDSRSFSLPAQLNSSNALSFMKEQYIGIGKYLESASGNEINPDNLSYWLDFYQKFRFNLTEAQRCLNLSAKDYYLLHLAAQRVPPEYLNELLEGALEGKDGLHNSITECNMSILLSGPVFYQPEILEELNKSGTYIFLEDLCHCKMLYIENNQLSGDSWDRLTATYFNMFPCPCRHAGPGFRSSHIKNIVKDKNINGVIFLLQKFCDPHFWDVVILQRELKKEGIPSLVLELDESFSTGQVKTRLSAFLEILQGG